MIYSNKFCGRSLLRCLLFRCRVTTEWNRKSFEHSAFPYFRSTSNSRSSWFQRSASSDRDSESKLSAAFDERKLTTTLLHRHKCLMWKTNKTLLAAPLKTEMSILNVDVMVCENCYSAGVTSGVSSNFMNRSPKMFRVLLINFPFFW